MGFPLSSFQQLAHLCRENTYRSSFDKYKLVSVLVFGPHDRAARRALKNSFERLHQTTGRDFAFIPFLDPPLKWQREHSRWMDVRNALPIELSTDEEVIISAVRNRFDLPLGPSILLTDSFGSNQYVVIPCDENDLVEKMEAIGEYAEGQLFRFPVDDPDFMTFLSRYDSVFLQKTENGESVSRNLVDILAVDSLFYHTGEYKEVFQYVQQEAKEWVYRTLRELSRKADAATDEEYETVLKRYSDYLALTLDTVKAQKPEDKYFDVSVDHEIFFNPGELHSIEPNYHSMELPKPRPMPAPTPSYDIPEHYVPLLTKYSRSMRANYNSILSFILRDQQGSTYPEFIPTPHQDFAPLGLYMGLIVEEEVNASIVQLSRQNAGIKMPDYYRLWDESHADLPPIETEGTKIYLNCKNTKISKDKYLVNTVSIGNAVWAVRKMMEKDPNLSFGPFGEEPFLTRILSFSRYRNRADHAGRYFGKRIFTEAHRAFMEICDKDLLYMATLKEQLMA